MTLPAEIERGLSTVRVMIEDLVTANVAHADLVEQLRADVFKLQTENTALHSDLTSAAVTITNLHAEIAALELTVPRLAAPAPDPLAEVLEPAPVVPAPRPSRIPPLASEVKDEPKSPVKAAAPAPSPVAVVTKNGRPLVVKGSGNK